MRISRSPRTWLLSWESGSYEYVTSSNGLRPWNVGGNARMELQKFRQLTQ
jgi:hypothetical protein